MNILKITGKDDLIVTGLKDIDWHNLNIYFADEGDHYDSCTDINSTNSNSIIKLSINQLISRFLPKKGAYKSLNDDNLNINTFKTFIFDYRSEKFKDINSIEGEHVNPLMLQFHDLITNLLHNKGFFPMNSSELDTRGRLWKILNMASEDLVSRFLSKLEDVGTGGFGQYIEGMGTNILTYNASECVLTLVMSQSPDSISSIYGNLFTLIRLGAHTKLWINFNWMDLPYSSQHFVDLIPEQLVNWCAQLEAQHNMKVHHLIKICNGLTLDNNIPLGMLDLSGKDALRLIGLLPRAGLVEL